jgi:hypothetical protein
MAPFLPPTLCPTAAPAAPPNAPPKTAPPSTAKALTLNDNNKTIANDFFIIVS